MSGSHHSTLTCVRTHTAHAHEHSITRLQQGIDPPPYVGLRDPIAAVATIPSPAQMQRRHQALPPSSFFSAVLCHECALASQCVLQQGRGGLHALVLCLANLGAKAPACACPCELASACMHVRGTVTLHVNVWARTLCRLQMCCSSCALVQESAALGLWGHFVKSEGEEGEEEEDEDEDEAPKPKNCMSYLARR